MEFLKEFVAEEKENFEPFDEFVGEAVLGGIVDATAYYLALGLKIDDKVELKLPMGTFRAAYKSKGDIENINVSFAESGDFIKCVNGDIENLPIMDELDSSYVNFIINTVGTGVAEPAKYPDKINSARVGIELSQMEAVFFVNEIAKKLAKLAKEFEKPGKLISFEIAKLGAFEFSYGDEKTTVRFIPDLIFKQAVKDDLHTSGTGMACSSFHGFGESTKKSGKKKAKKIKLHAK